MEPDFNSRTEELIDDELASKGLKVKRQEWREIAMTWASAIASGHEIDLRSLAPGQRHRKVFQLARELAVGTSFVLVTDHDPKPLYYQLQAEYRHQFFWNYLDEGPELWRVQIGRLQEAA